MLWIFSFTYVAIYSLATELYAFIRAETIIDSAIARAKATNKPLVIICQKSTFMFRHSLLDLPGFDYILPGFAPNPEAVVLDLCSLVQSDGGRTLENVPPENLFCVTQPWYCPSAYFRTKRIALCCPPHKPFIWTVENPLAILHPYMPWTSTPQ